ncbi:MAG: DNA methyltransferase [Nitrososphaeraceae archaeon]
MQSQETDESWSFKELGRAQTSYLTHDYHKYPAKFIPQLAERLIKDNSQPADLICDPFMGSGTTMVEAILNSRRSYGTDINPVSVLITKAKTTPIEPGFLNSQISSLLRRIKADIETKDGQVFLLKAQDFEVRVLDNKRIDYWFPEKQKIDLAIILSRVNSIYDHEVRTFLLCAFSNILKGCSRWMMKSVKPTIDKHKVIADAYKNFVLQTKRMVLKNEDFWKRIGRNEVDCTVDNKDARKMKVQNESTTLVITSPPYVTSYEYADLHQLTAIWLGYTNKLSDFRRKFIGAIQKNNVHVKLHSKQGREIVDELWPVNSRDAKAVEQYFFEMQECFEEMYRIVKRGGRICIVIGNTELRRISIQNTNVFVETMEEIGLKTHKIIKRPVPSKILPLTRDERTGRFSATVAADRLSYPIEYILIMEKV